MGLLGLTLNNKNSFTEFGLYIEEKHINPPLPKIIKDSLPYMNGEYDLSAIGTNNHVIYDTRTIIVKLLLQAGTMEDLYELYSDVLEWLLNTLQSQIVFDFSSGYYYLGRIETIPTFDEFVDNADLEVTFVCDPFKYLLDNPVISITSSQNIYNPYIYSSPNITIYGIGTFILNGKTFVTTETTTTLNYLTLENGNNTISFSGAITKVELTPNFRRL